MNQRLLAAARTLATALAAPLNDPESVGPNARENVTEFVRIAPYPQTPPEPRMNRAQRRAAARRR